MTSLSPDLDRPQLINSIANNALYSLCGKTAHSRVFQLFRSPGVMVVFYVRWPTIGTNSARSFCARCRACSSVRHQSDHGCFVDCRWAKISSEGRSVTNLLKSVVFSSGPTLFKIARSTSVSRDTSTALSTALRLNGQSEVSCENQDTSSGNRFACCRLYERPSTRACLKHGIYEDKPCQFLSQSQSCSSNILAERQISPLCVLM